MTFSAKVNTFATGNNVTNSGTFWQFAQDEFDDWATLVNTHASNSSRQVSRPKGYTDASTNLYAGMLIRALHPTLPDIFGLLRLSNSQVTIHQAIGDSWSNSTSNFNYGTYTTITSVNVNGLSTTAGAGETIVVYDDTENQEFWFCNWRTVNSSNQALMMIFKTTEGEWAIASGRYDYFTGNRTSNVPCVSYHTTGPIQYTVIPSRNLDFPFFQLVVNSNLASTAADRLAAKVNIKAANPRLGTSPILNPLTPIVVNEFNDVNHISIGSYFICNFEGVF